MAHYFRMDMTVYGEDDPVNYHRKISRLQRAGLFSDFIHADTEV